MSESWVAVEIYPKDYAKDRVALLPDFVKPVVEQLESSSLIQGFHFFFEAGFLLLRVRLVDEDQRDPVKSILNDSINLVQVSIDKVEFRDDYTGDRENYGTEGWGIVSDFFETGSRFSLLYHETAKMLAEGLEEKDKKGILKRRRLPTEGDSQAKFDPKRLVRCFLNQWGLTILGELDFHFQATWKRLSLGLGQDLDQLRAYKGPDRDEVAQKMRTYWLGNLQKLKDRSRQTVANAETFINKNFS